jgi:hypothetical protein
LGFGGLITGLAIAGLAGLAGGVSLLGGAGVVSGVLSCRGSVVCAFSGSGAGIFGFITGRGITGFTIGLLTGACSVFISAGGGIAGVSGIGALSLCILSSVTGLGFITGRGITGFAIGLVTGACSVLDSDDGGVVIGASVVGVLSLLILSSVAGFCFITGFGITGLATVGFAGVDDAADVCSVSVGVVVPPDDVEGGDVGSFGFIIGRATAGFGLDCSVSVLGTEVSEVFAGGVTSNFFSTDFKTSGNASIA